MDNLLLTGTRSYEQIFLSELKLRQVFRALSLVKNVTTNQGLTYKENSKIIF